jgi:hypothetical protein
MFIVHKPANGWRISRRRAETADETEKGIFKDETRNSKTLDGAVGFARGLGRRFYWVKSSCSSIEARSSP